MHRLERVTCNTEREILMASSLWMLAAIPGGVMDSCDGFILGWQHLDAVTSASSSIPHAGERLRDAG